MLKVKLIVLFLFLTLVTCYGGYCGICPNHTLCIYHSPGPSLACRGYDNSALLMKHDIDGIVSRINQRRNIVASGFSRNLPPAANMRKIEWSEELAMFAQRWADQCDSSIRPDKEDECRNLGDTFVGQNIATVFGPSPGLNIRSFIDVWFMQTLDYKGSVSYYNESQDARTNYFTQLIWAETDTVGCGKARFFIEYEGISVERLVCNFAPKGNIHGKPVYAIGYSATQCPENLKPDEIFSSLCGHQIHRNGRFKTKSPHVSSSLRILNLSNNSTKLEIDPIRSNLQMKVIGNVTSDQRNQRIRHVFVNNTYGGIPTVHPNQTLWNNIRNTSRGPGLRRYQTEERRHSRVHHSHDHKDNILLTHKGNTGENFRRYDYTTETFTSYPNANYRKQFPHCTRTPAINNDGASRVMSERVSNKCTKGMKNDGNPLTPWCHSSPRDICPCSHRSTCPTATHCGCTPKAARNEEEERNNNENTRQSSEFHYYDIFHDIAIRSGGKTSNTATTSSNKIPWFIRSTAGDKYLNTMSILLREDNQNRQVNDPLDYPKYLDQELDYSYSSFDSSKRQRRQAGVQNTFKPFWQMDEYKKPAQLKSLRYTTLSNQKHHKSRRTLLNSATEPITIKLQTNIHSGHDDHITEKYLSFDELMHLRKFNPDYYDARRQAKTNKKQDETNEMKGEAKKTTKKGDTSTTTNEKKHKTETTHTTEEYTTNTPFKRKKHCTRKITCTWTAATMTGSDGRVIDPGHRGGSRTPPGYVEGCTRTSTCTRDFLNRNKISTTTVAIPSEDPDTDEDYCEKR